MLGVPVLSCKRQKPYSFNRNQTDFKNYVVYCYGLYETSTHIFPIFTRKVPVNARSSTCLAFKQSRNLTDTILETVSKIARVRKHGPVNSGNL